MDVIVGGATEDTEILDARVDARGVVHPNLGHATRGIHSEVISLGEELSHDAANLEQEIQDREAAVSQEAEARENADNAHEAEISKLNDTDAKTSDVLQDLQWRTDDNANAILSTALTLNREINKRRETSTVFNNALAVEQAQREEKDAVLHADFVNEKTLHQYESDFLRDEINLLVKAILAGQISFAQAVKNLKTNVKAEADVRILQDK